jgi:hypothetical protein
MISRSTSRVVLPPLLALGLIALVVRPVDATDITPATDLASTGSPVAPAPAAGGVSISVPAVAFTEQIALADGRVRTAVLVNIAERGGTGSIVGLPGCFVTAKPGVPAWLDCAYGGGTGPLTVAVTLKDGVRVTHTVVPIRR